MAVRQSIVVAGDDGELHVRHQLAPNGSWSGWQPLGAPPGERLLLPTLTSSLDGRLELFAFSTTHRGMWHRWQTAQYGGWHSWVRVPDPPGVSWHEGNIAVRAGQDGRLELFCVNGTDRPSPLDQPANRVWHRWQTVVNGGWSAWKQHGQPPDAEQLWLRLGLNTNGTLDLLAGVATPGAATQQFHTWRLPQQTPNGSWSPWTMVTDYPDPFLPYLLRTVGRNADGRLEGFAVEGSTGTAWQSFQTSPGGAWHAWVARGKPPGRVLEGGSMVVASNGDGRLELFATANDGVDTDHNEIWHVWQTAPNNGWSSWQSLGAPGGGIDTAGLAVVVGASDDGRLELFATAVDGNLWHRWQMVGGGWSGWTNRGRPAGTGRVWLPAIHAS